MSIAHCKKLVIDYCVSDGRGTVLTYKPKRMKRGFFVVVIVMVQSVKTRYVKLMAQRLLESFVLTWIGQTTWRPLWMARPRRTLTPSRST